MLSVAVLLIPLIAAGLIVFAKLNIRHAKQLSFFSLALTFGLSLFMLREAALAPIRLVFGADPWNFYLFVTPPAAFMVSLFVGVALFIVWSSFSMIEHEVGSARTPAFYALSCALVSTLCGVVMTANLINIFIFMELSSFAAVGLIIIKNKPENMRAGLRYLILALFGSAFILMGTVIFHGVTGMLSISGIRAGLAENFYGNEYQVRSGIILFTIGIALKSGLFPLHIAAPDAYTFAPAPASAFLSGLVQKAYVFLYIVVLYEAVGVETLLADPVLSLLLFLLILTGAIAIIVCSILALLQSDIKRLLAYSSISQVGYLFLGIGLGTRIGLFAVMLHFLTHAITKSMLFLTMGGVIMETGTSDLKELPNKATQMKVSMALFTLGALSIIGIPLLIGFNSKWYFAMSMIDASYYWFLGAVGTSALLSSCYYLPVAVRTFFRPASEALPEGNFNERPFRHLVPIIILASLMFIFAMFGAPLNSFIQHSIESIW